MLNPETRQRLIAAIQEHAETYSDDHGIILRTLRVGPGRLDRITIQDGEFSSRSEISRRILDQSLVSIQQPQKTGQVFEYTSLRTGERISLPYAEMIRLRAAVSLDKDRPGPPEMAVSSGLATFGHLGGEIVTQLTLEGKDAMRLFLLV